jgi:energy-coupling factor transporter ATP-binding protein EcfA2
MTSKKKMIKAEQLEIVYPKRKGLETTPALQNFSLTVEEEEFIAVIGKSGAGKTTLIPGLLDRLPGSSVVRLTDVLKPASRAGKAAALAKTTLARPRLAGALVAWLYPHGRDALARSTMLCRRDQHVRRVVGPTVIDDGALHLLFWMAAAYGGGGHERVARRLCLPDVIVYVDVDPVVAYRRVAGTVDRVPEGVSRDEVVGYLERYGYQARRLLPQLGVPVVSPDDL